MGACDGNFVSDKSKVIFSVTDFRNKKIEFSKPVERVVCLIESGLSGLYMLKVEDKIVGIPSDVYLTKVNKFYSKLDKRIETKQLATPGNWDFVNIEQVVALKPDLVIIWASQNEIISNLENFKIPVYAVMINSFDDVYKEMSDFGKIFNSTERADSLIHFTKNNLNEISKNNTQKNKKRVYFMWSQGINETSGKNSTVNELLTFAGTQNVCEMEQEHISVNIEKIIEWQPEMIVMWNNEKLNSIDIINNSQLKDIQAIKTKNVYELPNVFNCDFWTLKMQYPIKLISNWANENTVNFDEKTELNNLYKTLYGKSIVE